MGLFGDRRLGFWKREATVYTDNPLLSEWFKAALESERIRNLWESDRARWETEFRDHMKSESCEFYLRRRLCQKYAWAIPCRTALDAIMRHSPNGIVEIGAGVGYWAKMLRDRGADVLAYDRHPNPKNFYHAGNVPLTDVIYGTSGLAKRHSERTLFLCWPPCAEPMAFDCLRLFKGSTFIYVGEGNGGCTGDDKFHEMLGEMWEEIDDVDIPQWGGIHDYLTVYRRK